MSDAWFAGEIEWLAITVLDLTEPSDLEDGEYAPDLGTYTGMLTFAVTRLAELTKASGVRARGTWQAELNRAEQLQAEVTHRAARSGRVGTMTLVDGRTLTVHMELDTDALDVLAPVRWVRCTVDGQPVSERDARNLVRESQ